MKLLYSLLILLYIGNTANAQAYCDGYNLDAARVNYFIKTLSTSGANQNLSLTDGTYPVKATETDLEGYIYDQSQKLIIQPGQSVSINITSNVPASGNLWALFSCWIDFNGDGDFIDEGEQLVQLGEATSNVATVKDIEFTFDVPQDVTIGSSRIRMRYRDSWTQSGVTPVFESCGAYNGGTTYDFDVEFTSATAIDKTTDLAVQLVSSTVSSELEIRVNDQAAKPEVKIFDVTGRLVKSANSTVVNVSELKPNLYIAHITYLDKQYVHKVLVRRK